MKVCTKCGEDKPLSEYYRDARYKGGHTAQCKVCIIAKQAEYRERVAAERVAPAPTDTKTCTKCDENKPLSEYGKLSAAPDGLSYHCKSCQNSAAKARYEANREKVLAQKKAYREANREKIAASEKAYYEANREKILVAAKAYHAEKWANDPEYRAQYYANTRRRKRLLASAVQEPYSREDIFERDNWTCQLCQEPIDQNLQWPERWAASIDHIVPISHGGDDTPDNVQAAHLSCNQGKGNRVELEDQAMLAGVAG